MLVIYDSSTLILLAKSDLIDTALKYFGKFIIPEAVYQESVERGKEAKKHDAFLIESRIKENKIEVKKLKRKEFTKKLLKDFKLGKGEAESIGLYLQEEGDLLGVDDKEGIKVCKIFKIKIFTAISLLVHLANEGEIDNWKPKLEKLKKYGRYSDKIISKALNSINKKK